jgi:hypothetical protein
MKEANGLQRKFSGHRMIYTSQWLKLGEGKLLSDSGMQIFPKLGSSDKTIGTISFFMLHTWTISK